MALVECHNLSLRYPVINAAELSFKATLRAAATGGIIRRSGRSFEISALEGIDLKVTDGERVGIVGHNGAGKTTLLKVIAGIYRAQTGSFRRVGRVATVINPANGLELGSSGYENIENLGLLNGLSRPEVKARTADIEEFTELGDFLSLTVETYSSGMMARLAFAVATAMSPEILVIDENLATGDVRFVEGARKRMAEMMARSGIVILASHSLSTLSSFVDRAVLLDHGRIVADGPVAEVVERYTQSVHAVQ